MVSYLRLPIPLSPTPVTAEGWRRWPRRQALIFFVRRLPDRLVATARVKQQGKLTGVYDIEIVNQQQKIVALFRGKSHRIGGTITGDV